MAAKLIYTFLVTLVAVSSSYQISHFGDSHIVLALIWFVTGFGICKVCFEHSRSE